MNIPRAAETGQAGGNRSGSALERISIAIDGPGGAGKSTLARAAARELGYLYLDTGALYRTVGLAVRERGIDPDDRDAVAGVLEEINIRIEYGADGMQHVLLSGRDVSAAIRENDISYYASRVSANPAVRDFLLDLQREMARNDNVVMDGRDIGTVVLPEAALKIFLTASLPARANRRLAELAARGEKVTLEQVLSDMQARDEQDTHRAAAPLRAAPDAVAVDTTDLTREQTIETVLALVHSRFPPEAAL